MEHKIQLYDNFPSALFICLTPFSQGQFGLIGCMILMKEFISLTTVAIEIGKRHFSMINENTWSDKTLQPQNIHFEKASPKS